MDIDTLLSKKAFGYMKQYTVAGYMWRLVIKVDFKSDFEANIGENHMTILLTDQYNPILLLHYKPASRLLACHLISTTVRAVVTVLKG